MDIEKRRYNQITHIMTYIDTQNEMPPTARLHIAIDWYCTWIHTACGNNRPQA